MEKVLSQSSAGAGERKKRFYYGKNKNGNVFKSMYCFRYGRNDMVYLVWN